MNCVICTKPRESVHGFLCAGHFSRFAAMLRQVEEEALALDPVPSMAIQTDGGGGSLPSERAPARLDVLAFADPQTRRWVPDDTPRFNPPAPKSFGPWCLFCDHDSCTDWRTGRRRDLHDDEHDAGSARLLSILGVLHGWARVVREDRDLADPERVTITGERDLLTRHLDWIAAQPFVDEAFAEIRDLFEGLKALNHTQDDRPAGSCFLFDENGALCSGRIWRRESRRVVWRVTEDRCERQPVEVNDGPAYCDKCGKEWDGADLDRLNLILEREALEAARPKTEDGRRMLTQQELMVELGMTWNNVRVIIHRKHLKSVDGHYDPKDFKGKMTA